MMMMMRVVVVVHVVATTTSVRAANEEEDARTRVVTFRACDTSNGDYDGDIDDAVARARSQCFVADVIADGADGGATCAVMADTASAWRVRGARAERLDDACWTMEARDARAIVRLRTSDARACAMDAYDVFRVEGVYACRARDGRLFPYSTMLLGEVVALADAAIYLADAAYHLRNRTSSDDDEDDGAGDDRAGSFTLFWPSSY